MKKQSTHPTINMPHQRYQGYCETPWGIALLEHHDQTIYRFEFTSKREIKIDNNSQAVCDALISKPKKFHLAPEGTVFQRSVWTALQKIPLGTMCSYLDVAKMIGKPKSVRAVANAIGANPILSLIHI